ncbi:universal stress protein [Marichromatium bheemlicum]|uniref:Universal stress protein n=1 Tax=Marichromatium bheemlicum TaxID=365339 RepID=A0ABX1I8W8_9GAMM|nr:universal stress protein [Marichromatium bheemlicum]NKN33999.1 universal stress protein [Marichromatium bheemlicum]
MKRFKNILYVIADGIGPEHALARALTLAHNNQASLTVLAVLTTPPAGESQREAVARLERTLKVRLAAHHECCALHIEVRVGALAREALRQIEQCGHDLVINPAQPPERLERFLGGDDRQLLRNSPCPVWLMQPCERDNYDTLLLALDYDPARPETIDTPLNRRLLTLASSLALSDFATLHLVHVWDAPAELLFRVWSDAPDHSTRDYIESERIRHRRGLEALNMVLRETLGAKAHDYLAPRLHLPRGLATEQIRLLADQLDADLVVMGTAARRGLTGLLIGNTVEAILDQPPCSVLAVRP